MSTSDWAVAGSYFRGLQLRSDLPVPFGRRCAGRSIDER